MILEIWQGKDSEEIFQLQNLIVSEEAVLQTSWALQSVDLPGENHTIFSARLKSHIAEFKA